MINKDHMLHIDLYVDDCVAEFYVNGIPVKRLDSDTRVFHSMVAHHVLVDNLNEFEIVINPGPSPSQSRTMTQVESAALHQHSPKVLLRLVKYPVGAFAGEDESGEILAQLNWEYDSEQHSDLDFPMFTKSTYDLGNHLGRWTWQNAQPLQGEASINELKPIVSELYNAFVHGRSSVIVSMMKPYLQDYGCALSGLGTETLTRNIINDINSNAQNTALATAYDESELDLRICGNGTLIEVINKDWLPTLRLIDEVGGSYKLPLFMAKISGRWNIVLV